MAVLAEVDFFTVGILTWRGLVTYYVLFFIHLERRHVSLAGITPAAASSREHIPRPNYLVNTARPLEGFVEVEGFGKEQAEATIRELVQEFGADPAATDLRARDARPRIHES